MYYQLLYPETEFYVVPVNADGITRENWRKNEEDDAVTGELSRIVKQFSTDAGEMTVTAVLLFRFSSREARCGQVRFCFCPDGQQPGGCHFQV